MALWKMATVTLPLAGTICCCPSRQVAGHSQAIKEDLGPAPVSGLKGAPRRGTTGRKVCGPVAPLRWELGHGLLLPGKCGDSRWVTLSTCPIWLGWLLL